jgi:hypothetical protein
MPNRWARAAGHRCPPSLAGSGELRHHGAHGLPRPDRGGGILYVAFSSKLEKFTTAGGATVNVGNLNGTKKGFSPGTTRPRRTRCSSILTAISRRSRRPR